MLKRVKITGEHGRWLAQAQGRFLPVIHSTWRVGLTDYLDPMKGAKIDGKRYSEYVQALREETEVILQRDKSGGLGRDGYIGIFSYKDFAVGEDGSIRLTLVSRTADPAP